MRCSARGCRNEATHNDGSHRESWCDLHLVPSAKLARDVMGQVRIGLLSVSYDHSSARNYGEPRWCISSAETGEPLGEYHTYAEARALTMAEAAEVAGVGLRRVQQAAQSGALRTTETVGGYRTTAAWIAQWRAASRRPGRPRKEEER